MRKFFAVLAASVIAMTAAADTATAETLGPLDITVVFNGRVLDAHWGATNQNGTPVQLWDNYGDLQFNQRWRWLDW
jgi:hypothetical protein